MKKIILTLMSLAVLSSATNVFADGEATTTVTNNTAYPIELQNRRQNDGPFYEWNSFSTIDTINPGESKPITFSLTTKNKNPIEYRFPNVTEADLNTSFDANHIRGLKKGLTFHN